jgi:glycosyltransferase involved in cell wall biosynthesis
MEGERRNAGIAACKGEWIFEIDADERVNEELAQEIRATINTSEYGWHEILVDNHIGERLVRWGWGASFGKAAYPGLFRKGVKKWGNQRVHPALEWSATKGPMLNARLVHYVDRNISDMIRRLDSYSTARAKDLRQSGQIGSTANNVRRLFSRFFKCYVARKGYREGGYGLIIAICAGLYPLLSHLKAKLESD